MAIDKIKAMTEVLAKMEEMQKSTYDDINKDINKKRKAALEKIREYLNELADSLGGREIRIFLGRNVIFWDETYIEFNKKYITKRSSCSLTSDVLSEEKLNWQINTYYSTKQDDNDYWQFIDATNNIETSGNPKKWADGFLPLIENWTDIKAKIESGVEKDLTDRMQKIRENTTARVESYEKVTNFEA